MGMVGASCGIDGHHLPDGRLRSDPPKVVEALRQVLLDASEQVAVDPWTSPRQPDTWLCGQQVAVCEA